MGESDRHVGEADLIEYFDGDLAEEQATRIEEHFAECRACAERAREIFAVRIALESWTARAHGAAYLRARIQESMEALEREPAYAAWKDRVQSLRRTWKNRIDGAVRVILEAPDRPSRIVTDGLHGFLAPAGLWLFSLEPSPVHVRGRETKSAPAPSAAIAPGTPAARVVVSGKSKEILVRVDGLRPSDANPLVILVPIAAGRKPRLAELERQPDGESGVARFENLDPGEYLTLLHVGTSTEP